MRTTLWMLLTVLAFMPSVLGLQVLAPDHIIVTHAEERIPITLFNDSTEAQSLEATFFGPVRGVIQMPSRIQPNTEEMMELRVQNNPSFYNTSYYAELHVSAGNQTVARRLRISFTQPIEEPEIQPPRSQPQPDINANGIFTGLANLFQSPSIELGLQIVLVLLIIILLIALLTRVHNRLQQGEKENEQ